jgi:protein-S-isoprenylcysteine O-methyltransferase Ste14
MEYLILAVLMILWCFIHSSMISLTVTGYLKNRLGRNFRFYRLAYNAIALITFIPLVIYSGTLKGRVLFQWEGYMIILQLLLLITGVLLFISGARHYDMLQLFGIRQLKTGASHIALSKTGAIETSGVLGLTRHPWYLGAIILFWSGFQEFYASTLMTNIILTIYMIAGTFIEEKKLVVECGDEYRNYQEKVSMLIPFKWLFTKLTNKE